MSPETQNQKYDLFQHYKSCRRCGQEISTQRLSAAPVVCETCGWTNSDNEVKATQIQFKRFSTTAITLAGFIIAGFIHMVNWDKYSIEIIPLKAGQLVGALGSPSLTRLGDICLIQKKFDCVEQVYADLSRQDNEYNAKLGQLQYSRKNYSTATTTLNRYFTNGGMSLEAHYMAARSLEAQQRIDEAVTHYELVIKAKPDTLQVTVLQNYIRMLINAGRDNQARALITDVRSRGQNAIYFMEAEYKKLTASR